MDFYEYLNKTNKDMDISLLYGFRLSYNHLTNKLLQNRDDNQAILVADKYFETFPTLTKWDYASSVQMMNIYVLTQQEDEYYRIDEMIKTCTKKKDALESLKKMKTNNKRLLQTMQQNIQTLNRYNRIIRNTLK